MFLHEVEKTVFHLNLEAVIEKLLLWWVNKLCVKKHWTFKKPQIFNFRKALYSWNSDIFQPLASRYHKEFKLIQKILPSASEKRQRNIWIYLFFFLIYFLHIFTVATDNIKFFYLLMNHFSIRNTHSFTFKIFGKYPEISMTIERHQ